MVIRAKEKGFNFPYLRDERQSVARAYGAVRTPEVFVFDEKRKHRYHGRIDDNLYEPDQVCRHYLREALDAIINGKEVPLEETESVETLFRVYLPYIGLHESPLTSSSYTIDPFKTAKASSFQSPPD